MIHNSVNKPSASKKPDTLNKKYLQKDQRKSEFFITFNLKF